MVFDIDQNHAFVKRIATPASLVAKPENMKGICANAANHKLYFTTLTKLYCVDLVSEKTLWEKKLQGGCDRIDLRWRHCGGGRQADADLALRLFIDCTQLLPDRA